MKALIAKIFGQKNVKSHYDFSQLNSVLVRPIGDAVGDAVAHIAHIQQIKQAFPQLKIGVVVTERNREIYQHISFIDQVLDNSLVSYLQQRNQWQLLLDFQPSITTKTILSDFLLNAAIVINFGKRYKKIYNLESMRNYDFIATIDDQTHIKDYLLFTPLKSYLKDPIKGYYLESSQLKPLSENHSKLRILLNPQGSIREILAEELNQLLLGIEEHLLADIEFVLPTGRNIENYLAKLDSRFPIQLMEKMTTWEYFSLVKSADLVIAVDGGGVHIACAYQKPLLAFYANQPKNIARWQPINQAEHLMVIGKELTEDNNATKNFPLENAINWLNQQLKKRIS